jgi:hypothetical protein
VTTDQQRAHSLIDASQRLSTPHSLRLPSSCLAELTSCRGVVIDSPLGGWPRPRHAPDLG